MSREDQISPEVLEAIRSYVRNKLRVSLSQSDGTSGNQDGLQLAQDILVHFLEDRDRAEQPVAYALGIARRRVQDYFSDVRQTYTKLQDRLRYYLRNSPGFGLWPDASGGMLCGFAGWANERQSRADTKTLLSARQSPEVMHLPAFPTGDSDLLDRQDWNDLMEGIFRWFDKTVPFGELTGIICSVLRIKEPIQESIDAGGSDDNDPHPGIQVVSRAAGADRILEASQLLAQLWREILELLPRQRTAYLLNPPDDDTEILIHSGVTTVGEVRKAVGLTRQQFELLWKELIDDRERQAALSEIRPDDDDANFALLRRYLPIEDLIIAKLLACSRSQVIGLRNCARRRAHPPDAGIPERTALARQKTNLSAMVIPSFFSRLITLRVVRTGRPEERWICKNI